MQCGIIRIEPIIAFSALMLINFLVIFSFLFNDPANITKMKNAIETFPLIKTLSKVPINPSN